MDNSLVREEVIKTKATENLKYKKKLRTAQKVNAWAARAVLIFVCLITLFPIIAIVTASFSEGTNFVQSTLLPESWTFDNYKKVIENTDFLIWMKNSLIICFSVSIIQLLITIPAAFAFSKSDAYIHSSNAENIFSVSVIFFSIVFQQ